MSSSTVRTSVRRLRCLLAIQPGQEQKDEYIALNRARLNVRTDKEGRFRLEGAVPNGAFHLGVRHRGAFLDLGSRTKQLQVRAEEKLDLGDIRLRPAP